MISIKYINGLSWAPWFFNVYFLIILMKSFPVIWLNRFCMPWIEIFIFVSGQMAIYVIVCGGNIPFQLKKSLQTIIKHGSFKIKTPTQSFKILRNFGYYNKQRYTGIFSYEKMYYIYDLITRFLDNERHKFN